MRSGSLHSWSSIINDSIILLQVLLTLGLERQDCGIDLIACTGDYTCADTCAVQYSAVQCKFRSDRDQCVLFKELSTFYALCFLTQVLYVLCALETTLSLSLSLVSFDHFTLILHRRVCSLK